MTAPMIVPVLWLEGDGDAFGGSGEFGELKAGEEGSEPWLGDEEFDAGEGLLLIVPKLSLIFAGERTGEVLLVKVWLVSSVPVAPAVEALIPLVLSVGVEGVVPTLLFVDVGSDAPTLLFAGVEGDAGGLGGAEVVGV